MSSGPLVIRLAAPRRVPTAHLPTEKGICFRVLYYNENIKTGRCGPETLTRRHHLLRRHLTRRISLKAQAPRP
jgi:hypothetical protein